MRAHQNTLQERVWKETMRFQTFVINGYLAWMLVGVQMNRGSSSAHVQWLSHLIGGADDCDIINDVTRISHAIEGGNYKRGSATELEEFGCCYYYHWGVSAQVLASLPSHRPSTLAVSVPLK